LTRVEVKLKSVLDSVTGIQTSCGLRRRTRAGDTSIDLMQYRSRFSREPPPTSDATKAGGADT